MKILVVGLGSMGKRRIRILRDHFENNEISGIDPNPERRMETSKQFGIQVYYDFKTSFREIQPDAVFVCSPPLTHSDIVVYSLKNGAHTFSEINLINDRYQEILQNRGSLVAFLSSTMIYRKEIQWIMDNLEHRFPCTYRYHVGQFLPDWHPWEHYRNFFVADKQTNACREILAIELPWILKTFGPVKKVVSKSTTFSRLGLTYPDTYHILLTHKNGTIGNLSIDIISRKAARILEIYSDSVYIQWSGTPESLTEYLPDDRRDRPVNLYDSIEKDSRYSEQIIENAYLEEVINFFGLIDGSLKRNDIRYTYRDDLETLNLIDVIEESAEK